MGALWTMRLRLLKKTREEDLPVPYRYATALVLGVNAPWSACRSAAAAHQAQQHNTLETGTADVAGVLMEYIHVKEKKTNSVYLLDDELYSALQTCGVVRGNRDVLDKKRESALSTDDALELEQKQV